MNEQLNTAQEEAASADERFVRRAADVLNASVGELPPAITARLNSIRESAVTGADLLSAPMLTGAPASKPGDPLPVEVSVRLDEIRARAMQRAAQQSQHRQGVLAGWRERLGSRSFGVPAGAFASVCVLATTLAVFNLPVSDEPLPAALAEDVLLLASVDDIELYENLEFYQWLAENGL